MDIELPKEWSYTQEVDTVDIEEVMMAEEEIEGLLDKEESCEQKGMKEQGRNWLRNNRWNMFLCSTINN